MLPHGISRTRGGPQAAKDFFWYISNDKLIIQKIAQNGDDPLLIKKEWTNFGTRLQKTKLLNLSVGCMVNLKTTTFRSQITLKSSKTEQR